ECHPHQKQYREEANEIDENFEQICSKPPHAHDLPAVDQHQNDEPSGDIKPWSFIDRFVIHMAEYYNLFGMPALCPCIWDSVMPKGGHSFGDGHNIHGPA